MPGTAAVAGALRFRTCRRMSRHAAAMMAVMVSDTMAEVLPSLFPVAALSAALCPVHTSQEH